MMYKRYSLLFKFVLASLIVVGIGQVTTLSAQTEETTTPTPYVSIFDSMTPQSSAVSPSLPESTELPTETTQQSTEVPNSPTVAAPPRVESIFDQAAPTSQPIETDASVVPTRIPSIFDQPTTQSDNTGGSAPTRIPSIFDQATEQPAGGDGSSVTRVPSIFDSQPSGDTSTNTTTTTTSSVTSIFDTIQSDVIAYEGEELPDQEYCLSCHANPNLQMVLASGETLSVTVDEAAYAESVHGQHGTEGYRCIRCHVGMNEYPHEEVTAETARDLIIEFSTSCVRCHTNNYDEAMDGVHLDLLASGNKDAAVCADCHTAHSVQRLSDVDTGDPLPISNITSVEMCSSCHAEVYDHYASSVHGQALLEDGNTDVPTCTDCHGVHDTEGPSSNDSFHLFSPQICADCHADEELMSKYDINTDVFDTYVSDFHGTTVMLFQQTSPDQQVNAPVCTDCHGVHDIMSSEVENSPVMKDNLVETCQRCHPDASSDFPDAWLGHYQPSFDRTPIVAFVNLLYTILIPVVIGGLGLFVLTDIYRRMMVRREEEQED